MASFTLHINLRSVFSEHRLLQGPCGPTWRPESRTDSLRPSVTCMIYLCADPKWVLPGGGAAPWEPVVPEKQGDPPR